MHFQLPAILDGAPRYPDIIRLAGYKLAIILTGRRHGQHTGGNVALRGHLVHRALEPGRALPPRDDRWRPRALGLALELDDLAGGQALSLAPH